MSSGRRPQVLPSANTSRRTFRGLSGATDRNLPKQQARKRKNDLQKPRTPTESKYTTDDPSNNNLHQVNKVSPEVESEKCASEQKVDDPTIVELPSTLEIMHCKKRIRNVQESIQLSNSTIPKIWQENTLNAVQNCVKEAFSIFKHYECEEVDIDLCKELSLALFMLVQLGMQSGPIAGSKPGYFKRCGSDAAKMALQFLNESFPEEVLSIIGFTEKQRNAIQKWKSNAQKASETDKAPSKAMLKKQSRNRK